MSATTPSVVSALRLKPFFRQLFPQAKRSRSTSPPSRANSSTCSLVATKRSQTLHTIATELIEHIASFLDDTDLFSLRLTCRRLHDASLQTFLDVWFSVLQTELSGNGLHRLDDISRDDKLAGCVRQLRIGVRPVPNPPNREPLGFGNDWPRLESRCLDTSSQIVEDFHRIIARLPRCSAVIVEDLNTHPYLESSTTTLSISDAMHLLLSTIAAKSLPQLRSFRIHSEKGGKSMLYPSSLGPPIVFTDSFNTAWSSCIQDLELSWNAERDSVWKIATGLVAKSVHLRFLKLDLRWSEISNWCLRSLAGSGLPDQVEHVELWATRKVSPTTLRDFLAPFQNSLRSLSFVSVGVDRTGWHSVFEDMRLLAFARLECVTVEDCTADLGGPRDNSHLYFCPLGLRLDEAVRECGGEFEFVGSTHDLDVSRGFGRIDGVRYRGPAAGVQKAWKYLEDAAYMLAPNDTEDPGYPDMTSRLVKGPDGRPARWFEHEELWNAGVPKRRAQIKHSERRTEAPSYSYYYFDELIQTG